MRNWLIGLFAVLLILAGAAWWLVFDGRAPARAEGQFDLGAYRALIADDAPETLANTVRVEIIGASEAPSFAALAGDFQGDRTFVYAAFQLIGPAGAVVIDAAVDQPTLIEMSQGRGRFDADAHARLLEAIATADHVLITHEHIDHVMGIARHPEPDEIAPRLRLTAPQLAGLPEHAHGGALAPEIAGIATHDFTAPKRIAPGIVAHAAPGHTLGSIVIFARTTGGEYLFVGDIAWLMDNIEGPRARPRLIRYIIPGIDPDRPAVLRQLRALHDLAAAEPDLIIVPGHDEAYVRQRLDSGALEAGFITRTQQDAPAGP